jgi:hypothetical protein
MSSILSFTSRKTISFFASRSSRASITTPDHHGLPASAKAVLRQYSLEA